MSREPLAFEQETVGPKQQTLDVSVIVPTYCEAANLRELVTRISEALEQADLRGEIIVVDDNSPDETEQVCKELAMDFPLQLFVRKHERGLSSAVLHGMRHAVGVVFVVMDADLSHPTEALADLVATVQEGPADFVIGSRYIEGGSTEAGWGLFRWLNSKVATWLACPLVSVSDPMAGFFALRKNTFEQATCLDPIGYKIGLELIVKCGCQQVGEIPIHFRNRLHGESKLSLKEQLNYLRHLKRLYEYRLTHLVRLPQFLMVGCSGMLVDLAAFALLLRVLPLGGSRALAIWMAMTWNFALNRRFTFADAQRRPLLTQYLLFCGACLLGAVVNWSVSLGLCWSFLFFDEHRLLAAMLGIIPGTASNYLLSYYVVFRRRSQQTESDSTLAESGRAQADL